MSFSFVTAYPWWFLILCPLAGLLAAGILYFKSVKKNSENVRLARILFGLRFFSVTMIMFLLFGPFIRTRKKEVEKPVIVFAQDDSESLVIGKDSTNYKTTYKEQVESFLEKLVEEYDVQRYSFGSDLKEDLHWKFNDKETDFSGLFSELEARFSNRNLGAVIVASDGIYNKGTNPVFSSENLKAPFFTIALGDTNPRKDIFIPRISVNKIAYLGNTFPVQVFVDARKCAGQASKVTVSKGKEILYSSPINISKEYFTQSFSLQIDAKETGMQRYSVTVQPVDGELSVKNNVRDFFIDVLDSREKVLIVARAPHPDIGAIKSSIESSQTYQAEFALADQLNKPVKQFNLVILHSLPDNTPSSQALILQAKSAGVPVLFVAGNQTNWNAMTDAGAGVGVTDTKGRYNDVQAAVNKDFSLFQVSDELKGKIEKYPPLVSPFGTYRTAPGANILAFQKIGVVKTENPLITFTESNEIKYGVIAGEGIWRWRMTDFALHGDHKAFDELMSRIVQFMSSKVSKSQFRVNTKNTYAENEVIEFEAELYNKSFEPVNTDEVTLTIINSDSKKFPFTFSRTSSAYHLNAGSLPPGEYQYIAEVRGQNLKTSGRFIVTPLIAEQTNTIADHLLLNNLAKSKGGAMYYPGELDKLFNEIIARKDITSVSYLQTTMKEIIEEKWLFFIILFMLGAEWFVRKYNGLY